MIKFKKLCAALGVMLISNAVSEAAFVINLGGAEVSQILPADSLKLKSDAIKLTFDTIVIGQVRLTIDAANLKMFDGTAIPSSFDTQVMFNVNPSVTGITFSNLPDVGSDVKYASAKYGQNLYKLNDALRMFDVSIEYGSSNKDGGVARLQPGEKSVLTLTGAGLTEDSFRFQASTGKLSYGGIHIQGLNGGKSGKYGSTFISPSGSTAQVPEPASIAMWLTVAVGGAFAARRKSKKTVC